MFCHIYIYTIVMTPDGCRGLCLLINAFKGTALCVVGNEALNSLSSKAADRLQLAFRPKTRSAYASMFRTFVAFCIYTKACITNTNVRVVLSSLECLVGNSCSYCMVANYVSAIKANFVLYDLPFHVLDHPKVN